MAENLQLLKRRIKTAKNIAQIAKAMEMISASKIKKAQDAVTNNKPYSERIRELTERIALNVDFKKFSHPYLRLNSSDKKLLIVLSPDKGLCGSLNTNIYKRLLEVDTKNTSVITIGRRASLFLSKIGIEPLESLDAGSTLPSYSRVYYLVDLIHREYMQEKVSYVEILYPEFLSVFSQETTVKQLLPLSIPETDEGKLPYIFEPVAKELLSELLPYYLETSIYSVLLEAYTSEQAARMIAMQNAKNNAFDIADSLTLSYNKSRQEKITNEILDLNNAQ